jgi:hypothetical protein
VAAEELLDVLRILGICRLRRCLCLSEALGTAFNAVVAEELRLLDADVTLFSMALFRALFMTL